jgi:hypothetical protein
MRALLILCFAATAAIAKDPAVKLETIAGTELKRVILNAKAAERLGIKTSQVSEQPIVRRQMVGGLVTPPPGERQPAPGPRPGTFAGFALPKPQAAAGPSAPAVADEKGETWVRVLLSPAEYERLAKGKPARVLPLATRAQPAQEIWAKPSPLPAQEDAKRSMLVLYYVVAGSDHGLELNKRMRVELQLAGGEEKRKVVPYGAVYYDARGASWVYVNGRPLTYERSRVAVERIAGDLAVLAEGPPVGTPVVSVGAPLLYGAEIFGK